MPSQEQLNLVAQIVDQFSEPIRHMRSALNQFKKDELAAHTEGARGAQVHGRATQDLTRDVRGATEYIRSFFNPALIGLGIGALGTAEAVKSAGEALRSFATEGRGLDYLSKEVGLTVNQLVQLDAMASRIGSSSEQMNAGLQHMAFNLDQLHMNRGPLLHFFQEFGRWYGGLKQQLLHDDPWKAIQDSMKAIHTMTAPERREFIKGLGWDPEMMKLEGDEFNRVLKEVQKNVPTWSMDQTAAAKDLANAFDSARESFDRLRKDLSVEIAPTLTNFLKDITAELKKIHDLGIGETLRQEFGQEFRKEVTAEKAQLEKIRGGSIGRWLTDFFNNFITSPAHGAEETQRRGMLYGPQMPGAPQAPGASPYGGLGGAFATLGRNPNDPGTATEQTALREALTLERIEQFFTGGSGPGGGGGGEGAGYGGGGAGAAGLPGGPSGAAVYHGGHHGRPFSTGGGPMGRAGGSAPPGAMSTAMRAAMDQYVKEGGDPANARAAAAIMTGEAIAESQLNPHAQHDFKGGRPTGHGIYGARLERWTGMDAWIASQGHAADKDTVEWQMRAMVHEGMGSGAHNVRRHLMQATRENMFGLSRGREGVTQRFEAPSVENDRTGAIGRAYRSTDEDKQDNHRGMLYGPQLPEPRALGGPVRQGARYLVGEHGPEIFSPRSSGTIEHQPSWPKWEPRKQFGDMMQMMMGQKISGEAALKISLEGFPKGTRTSTSQSGSLFQEISVDRGRASPWAFMG